MRSLVRQLSRTFTAVERRMIRAGRRPLGSRLAGGTPVLLLTTVGRRTGRRRVTPLLFHRCEDGSLLLVAVNGAADWDPDWLHNLVADPHAEVEIDGARYEVDAQVFGDDERRARWDELCVAFPGLDEVQARTRRTIPIVRLRLAD